MPVDIVANYRRLSVMKTDQSNRTSQHQNPGDFSNSSEVHNQPNSAEFCPETIANNPMYVVNFRPGNPDRSINITRQTNSFRRSPHRENDRSINITRQTNSFRRSPHRENENVYHEPPDYRWGKVIVSVVE